MSVQNVFSRTTLYPAPLMCCFHLWNLQSLWSQEHMRRTALVGTSSSSSQPLLWVSSGGVRIASQHTRGTAAETYCTPRDLESGQQSGADPWEQKGPGWFYPPLLPPSTHQQPFPLPQPSDCDCLSSLLMRTLVMSLSSCSQSSVSPDCNVIILITTSKFLLHYDVATVVSRY